MCTGLSRNIFDSWNEEKYWLYWKIIDIYRINISNISKINLSSFMSSHLSIMRILWHLWNAIWKLWWYNLMQVIIMHWALKYSCRFLKRGTFSEYFIGFNFALLKTESFFSIIDWSKSELLWNCKGKA